MRKERDGVRVGRENATVIDAGTHALWVYDFEGRTHIGIPGDNCNEGLAIAMTEEATLRLIAELSRRLAARSERLEALAGQALARGDVGAAERPIAEMSMEEAQEELHEILLSIGYCPIAADEIIGQIEAGDFPPGLNVRASSLAEEIRRIAIVRAGLKVDADAREKARGA